MFSRTTGVEGAIAPILLTPQEGPHTTGGSEPPSRPPLSLPPPSPPLAETSPSDPPGTGTGWGPGAPLHLPAAAVPCRSSPSLAAPARPERPPQRGAQPSGTDGQHCPRGHRRREPLPMMMAQALTSPISFFSATRSGPPGAPRCSPPAIAARAALPRCRRRAHAPPPGRGVGGGGGRVVAAGRCWGLSAPL